MLPSRATVKCHLSCRLYQLLSYCSLYCFNRGSIMYRLIVLCVLVTVTLSVTADESVNSYERRAWSSYYRGRRTTLDTTPHTDGEDTYDYQLLGHTTANGNTQRQDGHGQLGNQGGHDHHAHGQGSDDRDYYNNGNMVTNQVSITLLTLFLVAMKYNMFKTV